MTEAIKKHNCWVIDGVSVLFIQSVRDNISYLIYMQPMCIMFTNSTFYSAHKSYGQFFFARLSALLNLRTMCALLPRV